MRRSILALLAAVLSQTVVAAPPDSGSFLQQFEQERLREDIAPPDRGPAIRPPTTAKDNGGSEIRFTPRSFDIRNASRFPAAALETLLSDTIGQEISLAELKQRVLRIADHYHRHGYPAAHAYLPPQTIGEDGRVEIRVIEGYLGEIRLKNESRLINKAAEARLPKIGTGDIIELEIIERPALLMNDIPGIEAQTILNPARDSGFVDIDITLRDKPLIDASLNFDNQGSRYTGDGTRKSLRMELHNPSSLGDLLRFNVVDGGPGMDYLEGRYQLPALLTGPFMVALELGRVNYRLGGPFATAGMLGSSKSADLVLAYPVIRGEAMNLWLGGRLQQKYLNDQTLSVNDERRRTIRNSRFNVNGDWRTNGGNFNSWSIAIASSNLDFADPFHRFLDANSANTQGRFTRADWWFSHFHQIETVKNASFSLSANGQLSDKNMDSSEKMVLGGAHGVRAYPSSEGMGDDGTLVSAELAYRLQPGIQLVAFADYGHIKYNHKPWAAVAGNNTLSLAGAGMGIRYDYSNTLSLSLQQAWRLTAAKPTSGADTPNGRLWLEMNLNLL